MAWIGHLLEFLSRYGLIDIFFGVGIVTYFQRKFRRRVAEGIDGIEIMPRIAARDSFVEIKIRNNSKEPLYLFRASFRPGYRSSETDTSSLGSRIRTTFFYHWENGDLPRVTEGTRTIRGDFVLQGLDPKGEEVDSLFLEPKSAGAFLVGIEESSQDDRVWDQILDKRRCGELRVHYVHGETGGLLQVQI